jgi:hypothetical protein
MHPSNSLTVLLAVLLVVLNGKAIINYLVWLRFKIRTYFKQLENETRDHNNTSRGPSAV